MPFTNKQYKNVSSLWAVSILPVVVFLLTCVSCKKFVDAGAPKTSLSQLTVYNTDVSAISVLTGLYQQISQDNYFAGSNGISLLVGLSADEFTLSSAVSSTDIKRYHYIDSLFSNETGTRGTQYWQTFYNYIFKCNSAIEGITASNTLTDGVRQQLLGEAKFTRAFLLFYLTNLYGEIPIPLGTSWQTNAAITRSKKSVVYDQIINDLNDAGNLLSENYLDAALQPYSGAVERVRPTKWVAAALLARAYLYNGDWLNAENRASLLINHSSLYSLLPLQNVFLKNSYEAIWQLQPIQPGRNTSDAVIYLLPARGPSSSNPVYLSPQLLSAFESGDQRRYNRNWVDSLLVGSTTYYFPYKYKAGLDASVTSVSDLSEYLMLFRLGEQYLIRAEARAQQGNISGAQSDLNMIRARANLPNTTAMDKTSLLGAILHERQVELFSELGHRWLDLKRTGNIDAVMSIVRPQKTNGATWKSYMQFYPVLFADIQRNPGLAQNSGY